MKFHEIGPLAVAENVQADLEKGLSPEEVKTRQKQFGPNEIQEGERPSLIILFFSQFKDFMIIVLLLATLISGLLGEYIDALAIISIVLLNGILGFFQEYRAERSLAALKELSAPTSFVKRDGKWQKIPSRELVPGDIIQFSSGDRIGADVRLVRVNSLEIEESALTGESVPVQKHVDPILEKDITLGDMQNIAFMGTLVTRGSGVGIVIGTGMNTAMGRIADLLQNQEALQTPLQRRLEQLGKILIAAAIALTILVVVIGIIQGHDVYTMFLAGVSLAVAAIPEGLPAIVTIALSLGVQRMIRKNALVRKLPAVETLGTASVICSDKTGTITQNKMTVTHLWANGETWTVSGQGYEPRGQFFYRGKERQPLQDEHFQRLLLYGMLCNHAKIFQDEKGYRLDGDPTEGALIVAGMKAGINEKDLAKYEIIKEFSFDSARKMMSVIVKDPEGNRYVITKGAPDVLIAKSSTFLHNGRRQVLSLHDKQQLLAVVETLAGQALRTLAVAYKPVEAIPEDERSAEEQLTFIGLFGMIDPPRPEVKEAIQICQNAGIKTVMITGDHALTAEAIARELDLLNDDDLVITGSKLDSMTEEDLKDIVDRTAVFARVSPEHKLKIVRALQMNGHIVAMTGDGVNDAPAIKAADIGIAMGINGTDVAKEASSLILLDDHFATIKEAIHEGRNIYENIRKFIRYLLASNVGEILVMLFAMVLALPLPLVPIQILWVNLVTDGLPAMALGVDQPEGDVMNRKPRDPREGVFARGLGWKIISRGFLIGSTTLIAFIVAYNRNPADLEYAQTIAFTTLVLAQLIHVFDCRSEHSIFARNPFENKYLVAAVLSSLLLMFPVIYFEPLQTIFKTAPILPIDWLLIVAMASIPTFLLAGSFYARKR